MISTTKQYKEKILSDDRQLRMKIIMNGNQEIDGHSLKNVSIHEVSNGKETLTIGSICSHSIKVTMLNVEGLAYENSSLEVYIGLVMDENIEWIPMGTFLVSEVSRNNPYEVSLEGYDKMNLLNVDYQPQITYPATLDDVVTDIVNQCHMTFKKVPFEHIVIDRPLAVTCKEMLSYMASLLGKNVRMNRYGQLEFFWYTDSQYAIEDHVLYQDGFKQTNLALTISSLTSGDEDHVLTCGSGYGITFANPYMTQERLNAIFQKINGFTYLPCQCLWRGDPSIEVCDLIQIKDHNVVIMENVISFDGGMKSSIESSGQTEKEVVMSKSPTEILLKKFYHTLLNSYKDISENILGHQGGYYTVDMDVNGYPCGWTIMNTPTLRDDTHLWRMSMGGFGYSEDGGKTFRHYAFDLDGRLSANVMTTGQLNGDMFELDLEKGTVKFGVRNNEGKITDPFLLLDENGLKIKHMSQLENDVSHLMKNFDLDIESNILTSQVYDPNTNIYTPNFLTNHLVLTAQAVDLDGKALSNVVYTWKRKTDKGLEDLVVGEEANGNTLTISHNLSTSVTFECRATFNLITKKKEITIISTKTGQNGQRGPQGNQLYTWIKYADTPTSGMSDNPSGKAYIGIATNKTTSSKSYKYSDYTWSLMKGAGITSITPLYCLSTSPTSLTSDLWGLEIPAWESGKYLWTRNEIVYNNPSSNEYTTPVYDGTWDAIGDVKDDYDTMSNDLIIQLSEAKQEFSSLVENNISSLQQEVSEKYISKETGELLLERTSKLEQDSKGWMFSFLDRVDELSGAVNKYEETLEYIRLENGCIILGQENNQLTLTIQRDKIVFMLANKELAYFSQGKLFVTDGEFIQSLKVGQFAFVPRTDGSLDFKKVGDQ